MTIKLKLSTGKEIELTQEEYTELVGKGNIVYIQVPVEKQPDFIPYVPVYPQYPWPVSPYGGPVITCNVSAESNPVFVHELNKVLKTYPLASHLV